MCTLWFGVYGNVTNYDQHRDIWASSCYIITLLWSRVCFHCLCACSYASAHEAVWAVARARFNFLKRRWMWSNGGGRLSVWRIIVLIIMKEMHGNSALFQLRCFPQNMYDLSVFRGTCSSKIDHSKVRGVLCTCVIPRGLFERGPMYARFVTS